MTVSTRRSSVWPPASLRHLALDLFDLPHHVLAHGGETVLRIGQATASAALLPEAGMPRVTGASPWDGSDHSATLPGRAAAKFGNYRLPTLARAVVADNRVLRCEKLAQHGNHQCVVFLLRQPRHGNRPHGTDIAHDDRKRAAVGSVAIGIQPRRRLERGAARAELSADIEASCARSGRRHGSCAGSIRRCRPRYPRAHNGTAAGRCGGCPQ